MLTDVWHAIQLYWWVVIIGFVVAVGVERLHPFYKVVFWTASVSLAVYVFLRVGVGGFMEIINNISEQLEGVSK